MSVRREKRKDPETGADREFYMIDFTYQHPDGRKERVRKVAPIQNKRAAERHEQELRQALHEGRYGKEQEVTPPEPKTMPTVAEFAEEFLNTYVLVNNKPSEQAAKRSIFTHHIVPALGRLPLDRVGYEVEPFKAVLKKKDLGAKRINNILAVVSKMLNYALERGVIERGGKVRLLKLPPSKYDFLDLDEYGRLLQAAASDSLWSTAILCAGEAGLRMGEIIALEWADLDFPAGHLTVERSDWLGLVGTTKGGRARTVPMTERLKGALEELRHHRRGPRVFTTKDGKPITRNHMKTPLWQACRQAGLREIGWHALRHTFCSHLALQGAVPKAIQELAGHTAMAVTMRYMHLAPAALRDAIALLDKRTRLPVHGNATAI
jgi:integrase